MGQESSYQATGGVSEFTESKKRQNLANMRHSRVVQNCRLCARLRLA